MSHLNDPEDVRRQYATEQNLRARAALYDETTGPDPKEVLWETIAACEPTRVLEVGGGEGLLAARLRDELGCDVVLVDQSARMVELASARGLAAEVGDVQALRFADATFDTVVAAWMLYHVTDIDRGLAEIARVLVPGGHLVANTASLHHLEEFRQLVGYPEASREHSFNAENGEAILRRHFTEVTRIAVSGTVVVRDRQKLVDYRASMMIETTPVPEDLPLPFVISTGGAVFLAKR